MYVTLYGRRAGNASFNLEESSEMRVLTLFMFKWSLISFSKRTLFLRFVYLSINLFIAVTAKRRKLLSGECRLTSDRLYMFRNVCVCAQLDVFVRVSRSFMSHSWGKAYVSQSVAAALILNCWSVSIVWKSIGSNMVFQIAKQKLLSIFNSC